VWVRRLRLLDLQAHALELINSSTQAEEQAYAVARATLDSTQPAVWWGKQADLALLRGIYKHGYGNYDAVRRDPEVRFLLFPRFFWVFSIYVRKRLKRYTEQVSCSAVE
jgi:hypothetical protein